MKRKKKIQEEGWHEVAYITHATRFNTKCKLKFLNEIFLKLFWLINLKCNEFRTDGWKIEGLVTVL